MTYLMSSIKLKLAIIFTLLTLLSACSGGSGSGSDEPTIPPSSAAAPTLNFNAIKNFQFAWTDVSDATFYKVLENADGNSGFTQVGNDIAQGTETYNYSAPLYARMNAQYILQTCNSGGCLDSSMLFVNSSLVEAIGYFKANITNIDDYFGSSVALSGDGNTLAVGVVFDSNGQAGVFNVKMPAIGTPNDQSGAVYVFTRNSITLEWSRQAYIKASNAEENDRFGFAISLNNDGSTLVVSAIREDSNATSINGNQNNNLSLGSGAAYVFVRDSSSLNWSQQAYIKSSSSEALDGFGQSLSLNANGNTLAVSTTRESSNAGAVYVFERSSSNWVQQAYIKASNTDENDEFGHSISISRDGNTLAVGAISEDSAATGIDGDQGNLSGSTTFNTGAVYLFTRNNATWSQQEYIKASTTYSEDQFGWSVALSGDGRTLAVGARNESSQTMGINGDDSDNSLNDAGAVYLFTLSGVNWVQQAYIKAENPDNGDRFGSSVTLNENGNTLAVGALNESGHATGINGSISNAKSDSGAVYVFSRNASTWRQQAYVKAPNPGVQYAFGFAVSLSNDGETLAISSHLEASRSTGIGGDQTDNSKSAAGAVYLY